MNKVKFAAIVAPVMLLVACSHDANTLDDALDGKSNTATVDLAEAYPSAKSLFVVCTSDDAAVSDVFGRDVLDEPEDDENWMIQQRFDSAILAETYKRDEVDLCGGQPRRDPRGDQGGARLRAPRRHVDPGRGARR